MYLYGRDKFITWCISEIHDEVFPRLYAADELLLNIKQSEIDKYIEEKNEQIIFSELNGRKCGFVFAENYISELGNKLCKLNPDIDFIAMINMGTKTVSYRAVKEDIDLGKDIAKLYGGGWLLFIQPIIALCKAIDAGTITALMVGLTVVKCIFAGTV
jgi:hypothetical protein